MTDLDEYEETEAVEPRGVRCDLCDDEEPSCEECSEDFVEGDIIFCAGECTHLCSKCYNKLKKSEGKV